LESRSLSGVEVCSAAASCHVHLCSLLCCFLGSASALVTFVCVL
jgi:hypothetical protein